MRHNKLQALLMSIAALMMLCLCGCSSFGADDTYVRTDDAEFQAEEAAAEIDFEAAADVVEQGVQNMNLDDQFLVKSWDTQIDEELFYLRILMQEDVFNALYYNSQNEKIGQAWNYMRDSMRDFTKTCSEFFLEYGFDTNVTVEIVNPFNTNNVILSISNGAVLYDVMSE